MELHPSLNLSHGQFTPDSNHPALPVVDSAFDHETVAT